MKIKGRYIVGEISYLLDVNKQNRKYLDMEFDESEIAKAFGIALRGIRKYKEVTLVELQKITDIPQPTISRYENGLMYPTLPQAIKLASYFQVSVGIIIWLGFCNIYENGDISKLYADFVNAVQIAKIKNRQH